MNGPNEPASEPDVLAVAIAELLRETVCGAVDQTTATCPICLEPLEWRTEDRAFLLSCGHEFCRDCLATYTVPPRTNLDPLVLPLVRKESCIENVPSAQAMAISAARVSIACPVKHDATLGKLGLTEEARVPLAYTLHHASYTTWDMQPCTHISMQPAASQTCVISHPRLLVTVRDNHERREVGHDYLPDDSQSLQRWVVCFRRLAH